MLTVSHKIKLTVIEEDFPVEVDGGVAEHSSGRVRPNPRTPPPPQAYGPVAGPVSS